MTLSIAIPTYNGAKYIRDALDTIIVQLNDVDEEIEIVISDNASTDETPEIIKEYQKKHSFIKYFCNEENLGADRNFDLAIKRATGKYVWMFGDDDLIDFGGIKKVIDILKEYNNLANIFVNYSVYNGDLTSRKDERALKIYKDIHCKNADAFFNNSIHSSVVASSNIVLRKLWLSTDTTKYFDTGWIHFGTISSFLILNNDYTSYCISKPYVILRQGEVRWFNKGTWKTYCNNLWDIVLKMLEKGYKKETVDKLLQNIKHFEI